MDHYDVAYAIEDLIEAMIEANDDDEIDRCQARLLHTLKEWKES